MEQVLTYIKSLWPVFIAASGFIVVLIIAVRYKLPDLTRRIEALEKKGAKVKDIDSAIDGFHTVCKFNQMTCQKEIAQQWAENLIEFDKKMGALYEKLNKIAVSNAKLVARVEVLLIDRQTDNNYKLNSHKED